MINRYERAPKPVYDTLLRLVSGRDYFVLTTNVDHQFQLAGFDKERLFYTQGDYGLWQCSKPCCQKTWDNEETVRRMAAEQKDIVSCGISALNRFRVAAEIDRIGCVKLSIDPGVFFSAEFRHSKKAPCRTEKQLTNRSAAGLSVKICSLL